MVSKVEKNPVITAVCSPPDATHLYELHVFALDTKLQLDNGFYLNELYRQMDGHILEQCTIKGTYDN